MDPVPPPLPTPPAGDLAGRTVGEYHVVRKLGQGGMAFVYLAHQESLHRDVAFKVLKPELAGTQEHVERFVAEARAAARIVHPNIVQVYDVGEHRGLRYISQEYVDGVNLKEHIQQHGPLELRTVVHIVRQIALALHKAAIAGVIHRDIKPENVMFTRAGEAKVADFGLARAVIDVEEVRKTHPGMVMGTPLYMSPEQVEDREVDHRSDLYSLGVTAYYLICGRAPFTGDTPLSVALQHLRKAPPDLRQFRPETPEALVAIVLRLLQKRREDRYSSAVELLRALRPVAESLGDLSHDEPAEAWAVNEQVSLSESRVEQLGAAMVQESRHRATGVIRGLALAAGSLLTIPLGIGLAYVTRPTPLFPESMEAPASEALDTMEEQYTHAMVVGTEPAIRAVWTHHSPQSKGDEYLVNMAKRRLALLLVDEERLDEAEEVFTELAGLPDTELEFRTFGQLGQALVHWRRDDRTAMARKINAAMKNLREMTTVQRRQTLQPFEPQLQQMFQDRFGDILRGGLQAGNATDTAPKTDAPKTDALKFGAPKSEAAKTGTPKTGAVRNSDGPRPSN
ncbi:MAG: serine/threonine protein kinase [Planctomycetales bacterium]|nr:serine/threonine protein kinase [Planctomycetales bacterium]